MLAIYGTKRAHFTPPRPGLEELRVIHFQGDALRYYTTPHSGLRHAMLIDSALSIPRASRPSGFIILSGTFLNLASN
jgi:hypothetical protein